MKQIIDFRPIFDPALRTLDFGMLPGFNINKLYGVINLTRNAILYAPGATGYGVTAVSKKIITLETNTTAHDVNDLINVYYEADAKQDITVPETLDLVLNELKVMNVILAQGLNIDINDVESLRKELANKK